MPLLPSVAHQVLALAASYIIALQQDTQDSQEKAPVKGKAPVSWPKKMEDGGKKHGMHSSKLKEERRTVAIYPELHSGFHFSFQGMVVCFIV